MVGLQTLLAHFEIGDARANFLPSNKYLTTSSPGEKAHKENDKQKGAEKEEQSDSTKEGFPSYLERKGMGVRVLDLSRVLAGPYCSLLLSDLGADVLKLEIPGIGDDSRQFPPFKEGQSLYYVNLNRFAPLLLVDSINNTDSTGERKASLLI